MLWRAAKLLLSEKTRSKIRFVSREEAFKMLVKLQGPEAAEEVDRVMRLNRGTEGCRGSRFPSELSDHDDSMNFLGQQLSRQVTDQYPRNFGKAQTVSPHRRSALAFLPSFLCCRRRVPIP